MPDSSNTNQPDDRNDSESFRSIQKDSEDFGNVRNHSAAFRTEPRPAERKDNHTLTVREIARMFEEAGVARTERSIVNWCQPNRAGIARLDSYLDPNEHRYYITPDSVLRAIQEEKDKLATIGRAEDAGPIPKRSESQRGRETTDSESGDMIRVLQSEIMDLKITNKAKDYFIEQLKKEREDFVLERQGYVEKLMDFNRRVGELEYSTLRLDASAHDEPKLE